MSESKLWFTERKLLFDSIQLLKHIKNIDILKTEGGSNIKYDEASGLKGIGLESLYKDHANIDKSGDCWVCKCSGHWAGDKDCPFTKYGICNDYIKDSIDDLVVRFFYLQRDQKIERLEKKLQEYKEKSGVVSSILQMSEN